MPFAGLYHPVNKATGERMLIELNDEDMVAVRTKPCLISDRNTGIQYRITRKSCGLQCHCDAWAEEVK